FNKDNFFIDEIIVQGRDSINYMLKQAFPDEYFIEVIEDLNKSGTWNGASFWESRLPERVFRSQTYSARANWDDQHIIKVDFSQSTKITELTNTLELLKARYKQLTLPSKQLRNDVGGDDDKNTPSNDFRPDFKKSR